MIKAIKRLFRFEYLSPLDLETCRERLTFEYREKLRREGKHYKESPLGWSTSIYRNRKDEIVIDSDFSRAHFTYRITFEETDKGTILHCKHNPFTLCALFIPLFMILSTWILGGKTEIIELLDTGNVVEFLSSLVVPIVFTIVIGALSALLEYFARRAAGKRVKFLVDAKPYRL